jgi:PAS domain S-box-containing protein
MKKEPIRVLLLEDNPGDARLFREFLHEDSLVKVELDHVERLKTGLEYLAQGKPDVILLDLGLPDSQGLETFTQVYAQAQDMPIVVLTGLNDTEQAVEAVRAGAQDYLVKGELSGGLLVRAIHYAIERKRAEEALQESEQKYRLLVDTASETILVAQDGMLKFVNRMASDLTGYSEQELTSRPFPEFIHPDDRGMVVERYLRRIKGDEVQTLYAFRLMARDGSIKWVEINAVLIDWKGKPATLNFLNDITERKRAEEETRHRLNELEMLYAASITVSQSLEPKEVGEKMMANLLDRFPWQHAAINLFHAERETVELLAFQQPGLENEAERSAAEERIRTIIRQPGQGLTGWVIQHGQPVYCGDLTTDQRYIEVWPGMHSGLYVPLKVGERMIGCLSVESEQVNAFTETDEWLITTLANQAASALENVRLFEETSTRLKRVQALHSIDTAISTSLNLNVTLDVFLNQVIRLLGVDAADVLRFNPYTQILEYVSGYGFRTNALKHTRLRLGEGYAGVAGLERRIIQITHLDSEDTILLRSPSFKTEGFETGFCVPLIAKGQLMGVLEIFHRSPLAPDQEWIQFLQTLAGQAAIAIDNITLFDDLQLSNLKLSLAYDATIEGWSRALDLRDKETEGHTQRMTELTMDLARALNLQEDQIIHIRRGALLHDIGKMGVPDAILLKPGPLSDDEWKIMQRHPGYAFDMLSPIEYLRLAVDIPYSHHEKWDGSGYPQGLKGEQIPLSARIFAVVDVYDALVSDRPYRKAWPNAKAVQHLKAESGKHFEPRVVEAFLKMIDTV